MGKLKPLSISPHQSLSQHRSSFSNSAAGLVSPLYRYTRSASSSGTAAQSSKEYFDLSLSRSPTAPQQPQQQPSAGKMSSTTTTTTAAPIPSQSHARRPSSSFSSSWSSSIGGDDREPITPGGYNSSSGANGLTAAFANAASSTAGAKSLNSVSFAGGFSLGRVPSYPLSSADQQQQSAAASQQHKRFGSSSGVGLYPGLASSPPAAGGAGNENLSTSLGSNAGRGMSNLLRKLSISTGTSGALKMQPPPPPMSASLSSASSTTPTSAQVALSSAPAHMSGGGSGSRGNGTGEAISAPPQFGGFGDKARNVSGASSGMMSGSGSNDSIAQKSFGSSGAGISANDLVAAAPAPTSAPAQAKRGRGRQASIGAGDATKRRPSPMGERLLMGHFNAH